MRMNLSCITIAERVSLTTL